MLPTDIDIGIQTLLASSGYPVYQADEIPAYESKKNAAGYIVWDIEQVEPHLDSEGHSEPSTGKGTYEFELDVAIYNSAVTTRKSIADTVLDILQPVVGSKRTHLTSYNIGSTGVFVSYLRILNYDKIYAIKTGQSTPEVIGLIYSFSCKFVA